MIIDTHVHVWSDDFSQYPLAEGRAVIVQPIHYLYDIRYVADCVKRFPGKFAAMGLVEEDGFGGLRIHMSFPDNPSEWAAAIQDPIWRQAEALGVKRDRRQEGGSDGTTPQNRISRFHLFL